MRLDLFQVFQRPANDLSITLISGIQSHLQMLHHHGPTILPAVAATRIPAVTVPVRATVPAVMSPDHMTATVGVAGATAVDAIGGPWLTGDSLILLRCQPHSLYQGFQPGFVPQAGIIKFCVI